MPAEGTVDDYVIRSKRLNHYGGLVFSPGVPYPKLIPELGVAEVCHKIRIRTHHQHINALTADHFVIGAVGTFSVAEQIQTTQAARKNPLFSGLPSSFPAQVSHGQSALELPEDAIHLASSDIEPNQAFHIPPASWGVQFHPEFDAAVTAFITKEFSDTLESEGQDVERLLKNVEETPESVSILTNFKQIMEGNI